MKFGNFVLLACSLLSVGAVQDNFISWLKDIPSWSALEAGLLANIPESEDGLSDAAKADLVGFYLYTDNSSRFSPDQLLYNNAGSVAASRFNRSNPVTFFIHGFGHGYNCSFAQDIKDIYLNINETLNMIIVDWRPLAGDFTLSANNLTDIVQSSQAFLSYYESVKNTAIVGQSLGDMIKFLIDNGSTTLPKVRVVGFSLGAQVAGYAGRHLFETTGTKIPHIAGLDPAGPLYMSGRIGKCLSKNDADFVDFIHTDMGQSGTLLSLGHANFFVNGGFPPQPSCISYYVPNPNNDLSDFLAKLPFVVTGTCSHNTARLYFAQSITETDIPVEFCPTNDALLIQDGTFCISSPSTVFGDDISTKTRGSYYLKLKPVQASGIYSC